MTKKTTLDSQIFDDMMRNPLTFLMGLSQLAQNKSKTQTKIISKKNRNSIKQEKTR